MKRALTVTAALVAAVAVLIGLTLPPARLALPRLDDQTVAGIIHVHTNRSDGRGSPDEVAAAAARAGLKFLVFTDHGDATRTPDPPVYRSGVLCLDAVEISTTGGHYVALGLPAAPYPLAGEPRDVVDDVRRLGGFGIIAHPDSAKPSLQWRDWNAPFDGMEVINLDSTWRARAQWTGWRARLRVGEALLDYPFRSPETIARLVPGTESLYRWVALARRRRVVLTAGADAHAKLALMRGDDPASSRRYSLPFPGYRSTFEAMSVHVRLGSPFTGVAAADAAALLTAIRAGHLYVSLDGVAAPPSFSFTAANALGAVREGDELGVGGPVTLHVTSNAPDGFTTTVWAGTREIARRQARDFDVVAPADPDVYWVDIRSDGRTPTLWLVSNPVYVRAAEMTETPEPAPPASTESIFDGTENGWRIEHNGSSLGALDVAPLVGGGAALRLRYGLGGGPPDGQYVALVRDTPTGLARADRLTFTIRAEHPVRVSVQCRTAGQGGSDRWQRSVYVDTFDQPRTVFFDDAVPVGGGPAHLDPSAIRSLLLVIDTTNTKPGASGRVWIRNVELGMKN